MRYKRFFHQRGFVILAEPYEKMVKQAISHKGDMHALIARWERHAHRTRQNKDMGLMDACRTQLDTLITYHSLKLTDKFSLSLDETSALLKLCKTQRDGDFYDQLKAINHRRMLNYCYLYQRELAKAGWGGRWSRYIKKETPPNEDKLGGIEVLADKFVLMFGEGSGGNIDDMYGNFHPKGAFYFMDREEYENIITGQKLLIQTLKQPIEDPFMNAAIIHNEFARGHQFDKVFGFLFCRLYMNFALMLCGHAPIVIDSCKKDEYLQLIQPANLSNPQPLASFLVKSMNETYEGIILPILEDGVPYYIDLDSKQDYIEMISEYELAQHYFNEGNFHDAKLHIENAQNNAFSLDGIIPLIMGTHIARLSKFAEEIEKKLGEFKL